MPGSSASWRGMHLCAIRCTGLLDEWLVGAVGGRACRVLAGQGSAGLREAGLLPPRPMPISEPAGNPVSQPPNIHTATAATRQ